MGPLNIFEKVIMTVISIVFHSSVLYHHIYTLVLIENMDLSKGKTTLNIGYFKYYFLSSWNFAFQIIYLIFAIFCDMDNFLSEISLMPLLPEKFFEKLLKLKHSFFWVLVYPITVLVYTCFWAAFYINREMVMPLDWDEAVPTFLNNAIHSNILPFVFIEMIFVSQYQIQSNYKNHLILLMVYISYIGCIVSVYLISEKWVYPLLYDLKWPERILTFVVTYAYLYIVFSIGLHFNKLFTRIFWKKYDETDKSCLLATNAN